MKVYTGFILFLLLSSFCFALVRTFCSFFLSFFFCGDVNCWDNEKLSTTYSSNKKSRSTINLLRPALSCDRKIECHALFDEQRTLPWTPQYALHQNLMRLGAFIQSDNLVPFLPIDHTSGTLSRSFVSSSLRQHHTRFSAKPRQTHAALNSNFTSHANTQTPHFKSFLAALPVFSLLEVDKVAPFL